MAIPPVDVNLGHHSTSIEIAAHRNIANEITYGTVQGRYINQVRSREKKTRSCEA